ncbi:uncharacterized protein LOC122011645 [Zingiber officinale]|uniref:Pollen Ole e 1 allergen and extensin family protein n=1 Tax=Zingiber officinale TaxID=94328 RepID=A0A8J5FBW2_ZINOF|nr:uncharacterized protein LOC122011645 [Zingiber officinale]KAG6484516.1 hypothetical protein ZIOFF_053034 [Zingiber officinale]
MDKILYVLMALLLLLCSAVATRTAVQLSQEAELLREAGYGDEKLSTVLVGGAVVCNAGVKSLVPGVEVGVECKIGGGNVRWAYGKTDESGEFLIDLPSHLHANPKLEEDCVVRVHHIPKGSSTCNMAMGRRFKPLKLSFAQEGTRMYSAGTLTLLERSNKYHN